MKELVKVSIIVPVYKVEKLLPRCIESILKQSFTNFELILVDDGSPDKSGVICDEYEKIDKRIRVIHKENKGVSAARNSAIDCAKGKYIMFVDSDDWIDADMVEGMYLSSKEKFDLVVCGYKIISKYNIKENFLESRQAMEKQSIANNIIYIINEKQETCVWNKLYKADIIKDNNIRFIEDIGCVEDAIFNFMYFNHIKSLSILPKNYYNYNRIVETSINLRYLPERPRYEAERLKYLSILLKSLDIFEENLQIINRYQIEGIFNSITCINNKSCTLTLYDRYRFIREVTNKYNFYDIIPIYNNNLTNFSKINTIILKSRKPVLLLMLSLYIKLRQNN